MKGSNMEKELVMFCLNWLSNNAALLIELLKASVPVLALCVCGYALHAINRRTKDRTGV